MNKRFTDVVPIEDNAFPLHQNKRIIPPQGGSSLVGEVQLPIVGHCPHCGSPIYGPGTVTTSTVTMGIKYSCLCWRKTGMIENKERV